MQNILTGATSIIAPYPVTSGSGSLLTVTVSEISSDANGNLTLQWSQSYNGTSFGPGRTNLDKLDECPHRSTERWAMQTIPTIKTTKFRSLWVKSVTPIHPISAIRSAGP